MPSLHPPDRATDAAEAAERAASGGQRWQMAVAPGALLLAALSLTPIGSRVGIAAVDALAALRATAALAAGAVVASVADAGWLIALDSSGSPPAIPDERAGDPETSLRVVAQASASVPSAPGGPVSGPSVPGTVVPPGGVDTPAVDVTELPNIPDLLDPDGDLEVPTVEEIGQIADQIVDGLPAPVGDVVDDVETVVAALPAGLGSTLQNTLAAAQKPVSHLVASAPDPGDVIDDTLDDILDDTLLDDTLLGDLPLGDTVADLDDGLGDSLGDLGDGLGDTLEGVGDVLGDALDDTLGDGLGDALGDTLGDGLGDAVGDGVAGVGDGVGGVVGGLGGLL